MNLRLSPEDTFMFDPYTLPEIENLLDEIIFYNELSHNIMLKTFIKEKQLSRVFVPIATFNNDTLN